MALSSANVRVASTGGIYVAPVGTALPTDTSTALNAAFVELGYLSEDGVEEIPNRSTTEIKGWQEAATVREPTTDAKQQFQFTMIESKIATLEAYYGKTATPAAADGSIGINPALTGGRKAWVLTVVDGVEKERVVIAQGEVVEKGNVVYRNGEPIGYGITVTAYSVGGADPATKYSTALKTPA